MIKIDALALVVSNPNGLQISYERSVNNNISLLATFERCRYTSVTSETIINGASRDFSFIYSVKGFGFMPEVRIYPFSDEKPAPFGFFLGSHFRYRILKENFSDDGKSFNSKGNAHDLGLNLGYKFRIGQFAMDILGGYGIGGGKWTSTNGDRLLMDGFFRNDLKDFSNFIRFEVSLGFTFPKLDVNY